MQAARGTPLIHDETGSSGTRPPRRPALAIFATLALTWYVADQVTKVLAVARLSDGDVPVPGGVLTLHLVRNPGAAFSTGTEYTVALSCFAIVAAVVVGWIARRLRSRLWAVALGLLLAGVLGNLTDRLLREPGPMRGHVIDFLRLPSWPVFNLADISINLAAGLIVVQAFRGVRVDGARVEAEPSEEPPEPPGRSEPAEPSEDGRTS